MKGPEYGNVPEQNLPSVIIKETEEERTKRIELEAQAAREKAQRREQTLVRRITPEMQKRIDAANAADQFPAPLLSTDEVPQSLGFYDSAKPSAPQPRKSSRVGYIIGGISGALAVAASLTIATVARQKVQPSLSNNNPVPAETVAVVTTATNAAVATATPIETGTIPTTEPTAEPSMTVDLPEDVPTAKASAKPMPSINNKPWPKQTPKPKTDGIMREVPF